MRLATGKVVSGKIVVEGEPFPEGSSVTVLSSEENESFELGLQEEEALLASIAEAEAGDFVDGDQFLRDLRNRR